MGATTDGTAGEMVVGTISSWPVTRTPSIMELEPRAARGRPRQDDRTALVGR